MIKVMVVSCLLVMGLLAQNNEIANKIEKNITMKISGEQQEIQLLTTSNTAKKISPKSIQEALEKAGFFVSSNRDMNEPFKKQFKETGFEVYNLLTFYHKETVIALAKKHDNVGLFAPMSMSIYTKKGETTLSVALLSAEAMAKIMKVSSNERLLRELSALVLKTLQGALPNAKLEPLPYKSIEPKGELVTTVRMEMDLEEWEDELEELKMSFEGELAPNGFVIAGHNNLGDLFEDAGYDGFDFYEVYSICKLPVIFSIAKTRPEAGAFAPCSLYLEKRKEEKEMSIAFPSVYNWISTLGITDTKEIEVLENAQKKMQEILTSVME